MKPIRKPSASSGAPQAPHPRVVRAATAPAPHRHTAAEWDTFGPRAIVALQARVGIEEPEARARANWRRMSGDQRTATLDAFLTLFRRCPCEEAPDATTVVVTTPETTVVVAPDVGGGVSPDAVERASALLSANVAQLKQLAHRALRGRKPRDVVALCVELGSPWVALVPSLLPLRSWVEASGVLLGAGERRGAVLLLSRRLPALAPMFAAPIPPGKVHAAVLWGDEGVPFGSVFNVEPFEELPS